MNYLHPKYPLDVHLRIVNTSIDHIVINSLWWLIMGLPLFKSVFSRQQYLYIWINKLRKDGLQKEYDIDSDVTLVSDHRSSYMHDKRKSQMLLNTTGIKDGGAFYAMDNNFHNGKDAEFRESPRSAFFGAPDGRSLADESIAYGQAAWLPAAEERHQEDILMEVVMELSDDNDGREDKRPSPPRCRSPSQGVSKYDNRTSSSDRYIVPPAALHPYAPISIPEAPVIASSRLGETYYNSTGHSDSNKRSLV
ncbi:hypothetical protein LPJ66_002647 [Kickxella alabastrina]|uniref:Uncharacterized protein n=1 Tax=Kickxella alabastrina TaxID=61397 RepID=A0ACC1IQ79_9FUNG|nr:hypothetical protein LPJ66_002647 [Kickxella alabastrina]